VLKRLGSVIILGAICCVWVQLCYSNDSVSMNASALHEFDRLRSCPEQFATSGNRRVSFHVEGPEGAPTVIALHGMLTDRHTFVAPVPPQNVRIVAITRAGYGGTDDNSEYSYRAMAEDVRAVVDQLGIETFHVLGHSSGGPCALAVKAYMPDRARRCIVLAGDTEYAAAPDLDGTPSFLMPGRWLSGLVTSLVPKLLPFGFPLGRDGETARKLRAHGESWADMQITAANQATSFGRRASGMLADWKAERLPWGFQLESSQGADVEIWHGEEDTNLSVDVAKYTHEHIAPGSTLHIVPGMGHIDLALPNFLEDIYNSSQLQE